MRVGTILPIFFIAFWFAHALQAQVFSTIEEIDESSSILHITFKIAEGDYIYKDFLDIAIDSPCLQMSNPIYSHDPVAYYDKTFKETKKVFQKSFTLSCKITQKDAYQELAYVHTTYYQHSNKKCITQLIPIALQAKTLNHSTQIAIDTVESFTHEASKKTIKNEKATFETWLFEISSYAQQPLFLALMLVLLLVFIACVVSGKLCIALIVLLSFFYICWLVLPLHIFFWFTASCALCTGFFLLAAPLITKKKHWYRSLAGMFLIAGSIIGFAKAYSHTYLHRKSSIQKL